MKPNLYVYQLAQYIQDAGYIAALLTVHAIASLIDLTPWE